MCIGYMPPKMLEFLLYRVSKSWWETRTMFLLQSYLIICTLFSLTEGGSPRVIKDYACFNTIFEVSCPSGEKIVFQSARYGRNDTVISDRCQVPYQRNCDIDVHFPLNRQCAGKPKCSLAVNTALFNDPCGYEEFLQVSYRCAPAASIHQTCQGPTAPVLYDHGYIASPNYPGKYYMDASCFWTISVQKRQSIRITIFDFELDVKRGGRCYDVVEISTQDKEYFSDCGSMGKQVLDVDDHIATVSFKTRHTSLTQRGFFMYFEAIGPGCPDLEEPAHGAVAYFIEDDVLYANGTCDFGYFFMGTEVDTMQIKCKGSFWSEIMPDCMAIPPATSPKVIVMPSTTPTSDKASTVLEHSGSLIGIALGVVSAILLITLLLVLALYFHRRRKNAERKLDQWRVVINNLQDSAVNEENLKRGGDGVYYGAHDDGISVESCGKASPGCNIRKAKKKNKNKNYHDPSVDDPWQGRNLIGSGYDEEDLVDYMEHQRRCQNDYSTSPKYVTTADTTIISECPSCNSRRNSYSRLATVKYALARSRDSALESPMYCADGGWPQGGVPPRPPKRPQRTRSGQWDSPTKAAALVYQGPPVPLTQERRNLSRSAPDLLTMLPPPALLPSPDSDSAYVIVANPYWDSSMAARRTMTFANPGRSATLGAPQGMKVAKAVPPPKPPARAKPRC